VPESSSHRKRDHQGPFPFVSCGVPLKSSDLQKNRCPISVWRSCTSQADKNRNDPRVPARFRFLLGWCSRRSLALYFADLDFRWSAPEQFNRGKLTPKADCFSFAVCFFELMTLGQLPFDKLSNTEVVQVIVEGAEQVASHLITTDTPPGLRPILRRCWEVNPKLRPTFEEIVSELGPLLPPREHPSISTSESHSIGSASLNNSTASSPLENSHNFYSSFELTPLSRIDDDEPTESIAEYETKKVSESERVELRTRMDVVRRYVPNVVLDRIAKSVKCAGDDEIALSILGGRTEAVRYANAVILVVDISGFSTLAETVGGRSDVEDGAEIVADLINTLFEMFVTVIGRHGGDVLKIAGDALIVAFHVYPNGNPPRTVAEDCAAAFRCALEIIESVKSGVASEGDEQFHSDLATLDVHASVATGDIYCAAVGGVENSYEFFATGDAFAQLAVDIAERGQVIISERCLSAAGGETTCEVERVDDGLWLLRSSKAEIPPPVPPVDLPVVPTAQSAVEMYFPQALRPALNAGSLKTDALRSEMRAVSTVFILLQSNVGVSDLLVTIQVISELVRSLQGLLFASGGLLRQFLVDDKGCTVIIANYGAPVAHADDAARAVEFAMSALDQVQDLWSNGELTAFAGVTTGRAFCGLVGSPLRHEVRVFIPPDFLCLLFFVNPFRFS
jgi:class 3 adenylate cyclase